MLAYNDLKKGVIFVMQGEPYEVMEYAFLRMQQRKPVAKCKIKNLISGKVTEQNFHSSESFDEAEITKVEVKYLYNTKGQFWFCPKDKPAERFMLTEAQVGIAGKFMQSNSMVNAIKFGDLILSIKPTIKVDLKITETPPGEKGNTAQGGTKAATLETGAVIQVPLFVNQGDIVRINTETGDYYERVEKGKA
ncbi:MAG: elongation factor P [bacterium]|nr:elongation factor P [bacterium]